MRKWLALAALAGALQGQVFVQRDPRWRTVAVGPLADLPATCTANRSVYLCNGAGCPAAGVYLYCTATNTWTDAISAAITALCALPNQTGHAGKVLKTDGSAATWTAFLNLIPSAVQTIDAASDSIAADALNVRIAPDADYTLTSAPTIADGVDGQLLVISNNSASYSVTLQDESFLANSNLRLGGSNVTIVPRGSLLLAYNTALAAWVRADTPGGGGGGGGAPTDATYITQTPDATLSAEQALSALATGILKNTTTTGILSIAVAGDFPTLNQSTTGNAATATALAANGANCSAGYYPLGVDASGAVESCTAAGGGSHTESSADTLTNKTLDVEGTGNNITTVQHLGYVTATCQMGVASTGFALGSTNYPTATCVEGTNSVYGTLSFAENGAGAAQSIQGRFRLANDWTGGIDVNATWRTSAIAGDVVWQIQTACVADGETGDPAWNAAQAFAADVAKGTTLQWNDVTQLTGLTTTGCAAGETLLFKFLRDATDAGDTLAAAAELIWVQFKVRRTQ